MKDTNELRRKRANIVLEMRKILDLAEKPPRDLLADEQEKYTAMEKNLDKLEVEIEREERLQKTERELAAHQTDPARPDPGAGNGDGARVNPRATPEYRAAFNKWLLWGREALGTPELRALQADTDIAGGFIVTPQQFVTELIKAIDDSVIVRQFATVTPIGRAESLGAPSLDHDPADADWTSELGTGDEDTTMDFGKRELHPHPLAKRIKVSNKLLRVSVLAPDALVQARLAYKFAISEEKGFMSGSGSNQPLGLFTASALGISTGRDVSTGNATTSIGADGLIEALYSLKEGYQMRARWIFHRDAIKQIRKLKDGNGQYIWSPGLANGQPSMILDKPYSMSEYAPNTFTTGLYVGLVGDLKYYWIADALEMTIQRLVELYAATNQTGFIGRLETDGMPVLEEAFARVKLA